MLIVLPVADGRRGYSAAGVFGGLADGREHGVIRRGEMRLHEEGFNAKRAVVREHLRKTGTVTAGNGNQVDRKAHLSGTSSTFSKKVT